MTTISFDERPLLIDTAKYPQGILGLVYNTCGPTVGRGPLFDTPGVHVPTMHACACSFSACVCAVLYLFAFFVLQNHPCRTLQVSSHIQVLARKKVREYQAGIKVGGSTPPVGDTDGAPLPSLVTASLFLPLSPLFPSCLRFLFPPFSAILLCRFLATCRFSPGENLARSSQS